jgi:MFS family permease
MPNAVTLTNAIFCGFPLGAAFGGFLAAWMIPQFGWRSVLILGGAAPMVLVLLAARPLPNSVGIASGARSAPGPAHTARVICRAHSSLPSRQDCA